MENKDKSTKDFVEVKTDDNDKEYDDELVNRELWDHYSGLPNPNWYVEYKSSDDDEKK